MSCTVVVGGQYGSEGKGKVVALTAALHDAPWVVRCGGPNSGHTITVEGRDHVLRQVPAGAAHAGSRLFLSAGCAIDEAVLVRELRELRLSKDRVVVDPRAVLITESDRETENELGDRIASTASGTGAALARRMSRIRDVRLAGDSEVLPEYARLERVAPMVHAHIDAGGRVIIEGTQGFGLSLLHSQYYPNVTSRDTTAAGFASEVGVSPRQITEIVVVVRTFPIRVGGNSGPLRKEISWEEVRRRSGAPRTIPEFTSVTKRIRRVAEFDLREVLDACRYNRPTSLAVMGLDRLDFGNYGVTSASALTRPAEAFIAVLERESGVPVDWVGTGFATQDALRLSCSTTAKPCLAS
jgi:adenylosuccinate synthase